MGVLGPIEEDWQYNLLVVGYNLMVGALLSSVAALVIFILWGIAIKPVH
jgi:hypothetical protein